MSPEEWAFKIGELIKEAESDGFDVLVDRDYDLILEVREDAPPYRVTSYVPIEW